MKQYVLTVHSNSSFMKYALLERTQDSVEETSTFHILAKGLCEQIGMVGVSRIKFENCLDSLKSFRIPAALESHDDAFALILKLLIDEQKLIPTADDISAIVHYFSFGGDKFKEPITIDERFKKEIREYIPLDPFDLSANLRGAEVAQKTLPKVPQIAVFDTAFGSTSDKSSCDYSITDALDKSDLLRRYSFHGLCHKQAVEEVLSGDGYSRVLSVNIGNEPSVYAIKDGVVIDTSGGFSRKGGMIFSGSGCGDMDPAIVLYLQESAGYSINELRLLLEKRSGLFGICTREGLRQSRFDYNLNTHLAYKTHMTRIAKCMSSFLPILGGFDSIVFSGVGVNDSPMVSLLLD